MVQYVDDMFVIQKAEHNHQLLQHINSADPHMQFTAKEPNIDGSIPFLDILVLPGPDNTLLTTVYRKLTHTDQYLHWDSCNDLSIKDTVLNTLTHSARTDPTPS